MVFRSFSSRTNVRPLPVGPQGEGWWEPGPMLWHTTSPVLVGHVHRDVCGKAASRGAQNRTAKALKYGLAHPQPGCAPPSLPPERNQAGASSAALCPGGFDRVGPSLVCA